MNMLEGNTLSQVNGDMVFHTKSKCGNLMCPGKTAVLDNLSSTFYGWLDRVFTESPNTFWSTIGRYFGVYARAFNKAKWQLKGKNRYIVKCPSLARIGLPPRKLLQRLCHTEIWFLYQIARYQPHGKYASLVSYLDICDTCGSALASWTTGPVNTLTNKSPIEASQQSPLRKTQKHQLLFCTLDRRVEEGKQVKKREWTKPRHRVHASSSPSCVSPSKLSNSFAALSSLETEEDDVSEDSDELDNNNNLLSNDKQDKFSILRHELARLPSSILLSLSLDQLKEVFSADHDVLVTQFYYQELHDPFANE